MSGIFVQACINEDTVNKFSIRIKINRFSGELHFYMNEVQIKKHRWRKERIKLRFAFLSSIFLFVDTIHNA